MHNYNHKRLIQKITKLDEVPSESQAFSNWIQAEAHLSFLQKNAQTDELVIYASGDYTFVHSVIVPNVKLSPIDQDDLMNWDFNPYAPIASYVMGGGRDDVWVERGLSRSRSKTLENAMQLIFGRTFEGWTGSGRNYFELHQEYAHLSEIHWRPERKAYCRFNELGDLESVVSVTTQEDKGSNINLISFKWEPLEEYLLAANASLVRMFDFTLLRRSGFSGWSNEPPQKFYDSDYLFYNQHVMQNHAAYTRGVQIICSRPLGEAVFTEIKDRWSGQRNKEYAEFIAFDWRNGYIAKISTDPSATTNYFNADGNSLPFELSPAFFRPEVLLKYKADRDKYTVGERNVSCRAAWHLEGIDVNEAGQVHAYICYLRRLSYEEQLHWLSFNERPKTSISKRAFTNDFEGKWVTFMEPLQKVLSVIRHWDNDKVSWWVLREESLLDRVNIPLTESRDEWADAFMDLAKLVVEGFKTKPIRAKLDTAGIQYKKQDKTIALLEKLVNKEKVSGKPQKLVGLRTVQHVRSKAKGHVGGREAEQLARDAIAEHDSFGNHFQYVCKIVADELKTIEQRFGEL
ncbi:MAG: hypothetical protein ACPGWR_01140 [Ardenticatenaceae bacterium]